MAIDRVQNPNSNQPKDLGSWTAKGYLLGTRSRIFMRQVSVTSYLKSKGHRSLPLTKILNHLTMEALYQAVLRSGGVSPEI